jgi:putative FmdB family regulatory protein
MPIYEYACTACDHRTDILHGINDPGPHFCPSCGKEGTMRKVFALPAIHYKGSGWAKKDRSATSRSKRSDTKADGDSGDKTSDKPDTSDKGSDKADRGDKSGSTTSDGGSKSDSAAKGGTSSGSD